MTKSADLSTHSYSGYGTGFYARGMFSLSNGSRFGKKVIIFGVDDSSSVHINNREKDIFNFGKIPIGGSDDTTIKEKVEYSINFTLQQNKSCLNLH